jgi:hypothetical protein
MPDHIGGKKELFLAIFERLAADIDRHIAASADKSGELNGQIALVANARASTRYGHIDVPRWCWTRVTPRPASTASDATIEWIGRLTS